MKRKKILIIMQSLVGGGAEKVLVDILENINTNEFEIDIFLLDKKGIYLSKVMKNFRVLGVTPPSLDSSNKIKNRFEFLKFKIIKRLTNINLVFSILLNKKYDYEVAFLEGQATSFLSNRKSSATKIAWIHTDLRMHRTMPKSVESIAYSKMDKIICVSDSSRDSLLYLYPELTSKSRVIYNPINKRLIRDLSEDSGKNSVFTFVAIGRLVKEKGFDILLEASKRLVQDQISHKIIILGEGPEKAKLQDFIDNQNLSNNVQLLGFQSNPYKYISLSDCFISTSRYEGFSLVVAEAMVLGKPIIASNCTGPNELLGFGEYGILVNIDEFDSVVENMKKMIVDHELREIYSNKSIVRSKIFDLENTIFKIESLFRD